MENAEFKEKLETLIQGIKEYRYQEDFNPNWDFILEMLNESLKRTLPMVDEVRSTPIKSDSEAVK